MIKKYFLMLGVFFTLVLIGSVLNTNKVFAGTCTWNGSFNTNMNDSANWNVGGGCTGAPVDGDDLVFPSAPTNKTVNNPLPGLIINTMSFDGTYSIGGSPIALNAGYTSTTSQPFIQFDITLTADQVFEAGTLVDNTILLNGFDITFDSTNGNVSVLGDISGNGTITALGTNNHTTALQGNNNFVGTITATSNEFMLSSNNALGNGANILTISTQLALNNSSNIPNDIVFVGDRGIYSVLGDNELGGTLDFGTGDISISSPSGTSTTFSGVKTGSGDITISGPGRTIFNSDDTGLSGNLLVFNGFWVANSTHPSAINLSNGKLGGSGTLGPVTAYSGEIAPGNSPGILTVGDLALSPDDTLSFEINGTTVGTQYDQINSTGTINISGATLSLSLGYVPALGDEYTILTSAGTINGTFAGLPNGESINIGGYNFLITYTANSVSLIRGDVLNLPLFTVTPTTVNHGSPVVIHFQWSSTGPALTGNGEVFDGVTLLGTVSLVNGEGTFTISSLGAGTHLITVHYTGDDNFGGATSDPITLTVNPDLAATGVIVPFTVLFGLMSVGTLGIVLTYKKAKQY